MLRCTSSQNSDLILRARARTTRSHQPVRLPRRDEDEPVSSPAENIHFDPAPHIVPVGGHGGSSIELGTATFDLRDPGSVHAIVSVRFETRDEPGGKLSSFLLRKPKCLVKHPFSIACHIDILPRESTQLIRRARCCTTRIRGHLRLTPLNGGRRGRRSTRSAGAAARREAVRARVPVSFDRSAKR